MTDRDPAHSPEALARRVFDPARPAEELFAALLQAAVPGVADSPVTLCVRLAEANEPAVRTFVSGGAHPPQPQVCRRCPLSRPPGARVLHAPLGARAVPCRPRAAAALPAQGPAGLVHSQDRRAPRELAPALRQLAASAGELGSRIEFNRLFRDRFGRDCWLLGRSRNLLALDAFVRLAARVEIPALLVGDRGTGRIDAARLIHLLSWRGGGPFVRLAVSCLARETLGEEVANAAAVADRGTLFLSDVNEMPILLQSQLCEILEQGLGRPGPPSPPAPRTRTPDVRLVASASAGSGRGELYPPLRDELAFLCFDIQPLADRPEDVEQLANYFLHLYLRRPPGHGGAAARPCASRPAPRSLHEIRHSMAHRACLARHARPRGRPAGLDPGEPPSPLGQTATRGVDPRELAAVCARGTSGEALVRGLRHEPVRRAVLHLAQESRRRITLGALAAMALTSTSHLSHLFKSEVGLGPIAFVSLVRVERAKRLFAAEPSLNVSQVARAVGFADLRLFERAFKRQVGMPPGAFRRRLPFDSAAPLSPHPFGT